MTLDEKIALFFKGPAPITELGTFGSRFMLRREAQDCRIGKVIGEDAVIDEAMRGEHRLFATLMVVMAGVDLKSVELLDSPWPFIRVDAICLKQGNC